VSDTKDLSRGAKLDARPPTRDRLVANARPSRAACLTPVVSQGDVSGAAAESHRALVTSLSMRAVYFSYVFVSVENWMIRSWPWNG
jgi:hypothetical protein